MKSALFPFAKRLIICRWARSRALQRPPDAPQPAKRQTTPFTTLKMRKNTSDANITSKSLAETSTGRYQDSKSILGVLKLNRNAVESTGS